MTAFAVDHYGLQFVDPLKLLTIALAYLLWRHTPSPQGIGVPLELPTFGVLVTL